MLSKKNKNNKGSSAIVKARELQALIDLFNDTTMVEMQDNISSLQDALQSANNEISVLQTQVSAMASILSFIFDENGSITSEGYSNHSHIYFDKTISDTTDGTGIETDTQRTTQGVS